MENKNKILKMPRCFHAFRFGAMGNWIIDPWIKKKEWKILTRPRRNRSLIQGSRNVQSVYRAVCFRLLNQDVLSSAEKIKNLVQEVRQKRDISELKSRFCTLQPVLCLRHSRWVAVRPIKGNLKPKMNTYV